ncbi:MAG: hypothetical protein CL878_06015 [Dehalococcoidia bacterium]|nr:hypothetical protein [Dehalococcoidia bacterium]
MATSVPARPQTESGAIDAFCDRLIATSGELRRLLLVSKSVLTQVDDAPYLRYEDIPFDEAIVGDGLREVAEAARELAIVEPGAAATLDAVAADPTQIQRLTHSWFSAAERFARVCQEMNLDESLARLALEVAAKPYVAAAATALPPAVTTDHEPSGLCPWCGGAPDLAYLGESRGERNLVCGRCEMSWPVPRVGCPFCDNADPSTLSYAQSEDQGFRVYLCDACGRYLKTVDFRFAASEVPLYVYRLRTWTLDRIALADGYSCA